VNDNFVKKVLSDMSCVLNNYQIEKLKNALNHCLYGKVIVKNCDNELNVSIDYISCFLSSKKLEGCSDRTINYYKITIDMMYKSIEKNVKLIDTNDIRNYLSNYQKINNCSNVTIDNIRRILSSYFSWLEDEDFIIKSPIRRIHKIKTQILIKETYNDEILEKLRDGCNNIRDLAIIDFLSSTGVRVGELVQLNINDIDFVNRSCIVLGKGNKEREIYFDARTKLHLEKYLSMRKDDNKALFVSLISPYKRLNISGVEIRLRNIGKKSNILKVHPHKFRRTLATKAIDKGMPIEQVQQLLGHSKIDTTMHYAMVKQSNVKTSHQKYIC
jgi:integrase/recombinase XerD